MQSNLTYPNLSDPGHEATLSPPAICQGCGQVDETIHATVFQYVISILILSFKRGGGAGILCSKCQSRRGAGYTLVSVLLGPWGLPWGLLWTLEAISVNLSGGRQPDEINGSLLRSMGAYFWAIGDSAKAVEALKASLRFEENAEVRQVVTNLSATPRRTDAAEVPSGMSAAQTAIITILAILVLMVCVFGFGLLFVGR